MRKIKLSCCIVVLLIFQISIVKSQPINDVVIPEDVIRQNRLISKTEKEIEELQLLQDDWNLVKSILEENQNKIERIELSELKKFGEKSTKKQNEKDIVRGDFLKIISKIDISSTITSKEVQELEPRRYLIAQQKNYPEFLRGNRDVMFFRFGDISIEEIKEKYNYQNLFQEKNSVLQRLDNAFSEIDAKVKQIENSIAEKETVIVTLYNKKEKSGELHKIAIYLGLPLFCLTILLLFLFPYYLEFKKRDDNTDRNEKSRKTLLDVATVLLLTMTILILGLAKMINGEVLGTLLGGISGYVLNRNFRD